MTNCEAIERIKDHMSVHKIGEYPHIHLAEALKLAINALESPRPDWTPCAEGLPEAEELFDIQESYNLKRYWVTIDHKSGKEITRHVHQLAYAKSFIGFPAVEHVGWMEISGSWFQSGEVIAWMRVVPYNPDHKED